MPEGRPKRYDLTVPQTYYIREVASMFKRVPLGPLSKVTGVAIGVAGLVFTAILISFNPNEPVLPVAIASFVLAAVVATGFRWAPGVTALFSVIVLIAFSPVVKVVMFDPTDPGYGHVMMAALSLLAAIVTGLGATWQNYRSEQRIAPRWLSPSLVGLFTLWLGATFVASLTTTGAAVAISPEAAQEMVTVQAKNHTFVQQEIRVKAGQIVTVKLENQDGVNHTFDIDELNVHAQLPANQVNVAVFKATKPGTYTIYCLPHYSKQTGQGMKATLVVE